MNGIVLINKEENCTSRDVVNTIVKKFNTKKVGHTGTLDPLATGVLVLCVGKATKLVDYFTSKDKEYIAGVKLGIETDTLDVTGNILKQDDCSAITDREIIEVLNSMIFCYDQQVPIYSAVKINGKKLYEYAREGIDIELPTRNVTISSLELVSDIRRNGKTIEFEIKCSVSKGTYIRSLVRDIAYKLKTVGVMSSLIRTRQGIFNIDVCKKVNEITFDDIIPLEKVLDIHKVVVDDELKKEILNGKILSNIYNESLIMFIDRNNNILAIYEIYEKDNSLIKPYVMLGGNV